MFGNLSREQSFGLKIGEGPTGLNSRPKDFVILSSNFHKNNGYC